MCVVRQRLGRPRVRDRRRRGREPVEALAGGAGAHRQRAGVGEPAGHVGECQRDQQQQRQERGGDLGRRHARGDEHHAQAGRGGGEGGGCGDGPRGAAYGCGERGSLLLHRGQRTWRGGPLLQLAQAVGDLLDARAEDRARRDDLRLGSRHPAAGQHEGERTGGTDAEHDQAGSRCDEPGEQGRTQPDEHGRGDRLSHPEPVVEQGVDVVDDPGEEVPATGAEASGDERDEVGVDLRPALGELAQHHVVAQHALGVAQHRAREPEEAYAHDGDHEVEHRRLLAGAGDEPACRCGQRDAGRGRQRSEQRRGAQAPAGLRVVVGRRGRRGRRARRWVAAHDRGCGGFGVVCRHPRRPRRRRQLEHPVRGGEHGGAVGDDEDEAGAGEDGDGVEEHLLGLLVEVGARLVEEHHGSSRQHDARERDAGPLAGGEAGPVLAEGRVQPLGQGAHQVGEANGGERGPHPVLPGVGAPEADVGGDGVGQQPRSLRCPGDLVTPPRGIGPGQGSAAHHDVAVVGRQLATERREQGRLAAAGRPRDRHQPALGQVEVEGCGEGRVVTDDEAVQAERGACRALRSQRLRGRAGQQRVGIGQGRGALGGCVELRSDAAQRPVGLRRQEQHGERDPEVDRPGGQPQSDGDRHQRDRQRGDELEHGGGGEGDLEGVDGRPAVAVGDRADGRHLGLGPPVRDQRRQAPHHVEEVARQRLHRAPLGPGPVAGGEADEDCEDRHERQGQRHDEPRQGVEPGDRDEGEDGQDGSGHQRREVAGDVGLDPGHAAGGEHREAGGRDVGGAASSLEEPQAQRARHLAGRPRCRQLADVRRRGAEQHEPGEPPPGVRPVVPADRRHDQGAEREGLRHGRQAAEHATGDDDRERPARRAQVGADGRVERPHDASTLSPASSAVGMWWTAIRLRKTQ